MFCYGAVLELKNSLKIWFTVHFAVDLLFALPLFLVPAVFLRLFGWESVDPVTARLVAAALLGIGIESLLARRSTLESFKSMLMLKVIWSAAAAAGIALSLIEGAHSRPPLAWFILAVFIVFNLIWFRFLVIVNGELNKRSPH